MEDDLASLRDRDTERLNMALHSVARIHLTMDAVYLGRNKLYEHVGEFHSLWNAGLLQVQQMLPLRVTVAFDQVIRGPHTYDESCKFSFMASNTNTRTVRFVNVS